MECGAREKIEKSEKIKSSGKSGRAERRDKSGFCIREDKKKLFCKKSRKAAARCSGTDERNGKRESFFRAEGRLSIRQYAYAFFAESIFAKEGRADTISEDSIHGR